MTILTIFRLRWAIARARWRAALSGAQASPIGVLAGWAGQLIPLGMVLLASSVLTIVIACLLEQLIGRAEWRLAAAVVGAMSDLSMLLAIVAVLLADGSRFGFDPRPLSLLPLRRSMLLIGDGLLLVTLHPVAFVVWPLTLTILWGAVQSELAVGVCLVWVAFAAAVCAASVALFTQSLVREFVQRGLPPGVMTSLRIVALVAPLLWLFAPRSSLAQRLQVYTDLSSPGAVLARAVTLAPESSLESSLLASLVIAAAGGLAWLAWRIRLPAASTSRSSWFALRLPGRWRRVWGLPTATSPLLQSLTVAMTLIGLALILTRRGFDAPEMWPIVGLLSAWLISSAVAPMLANPLGLGGHPALIACLLPRSLIFWLLETQLVVVTGAAAILLLFAAALRYGIGSESAAMAVLMVGFSQLLIGAGVGSICGSYWPWRMTLCSPAEPLWAHGPSRLLVPAAQSLALAGPLLSIRMGQPLELSLSSTWLGATIALIGVLIAWRLLRRNSHRIGTALLS
jgi:hypothetical protein